MTADRLVVTHLILVESKIIFPAQIELIYIVSGNYHYFTHYFDKVKLVCLLNIMNQIHHILELSDF